MDDKNELLILAKNIRDFRIKAGLSQAKLGKEIGYSQQTINAYEQGLRVPPLKVLELLADFFHTSINVLLGKPKKKKEAEKKKSTILKKLKIVETLPQGAQKKVVEYAKLLAKANK